MLLMQGMCLECIDPFIGLAGRQAAGEKILTECILLRTYAIRAP